jgi:hypothetical protein
MVHQVAVMMVNLRREIQRKNVGLVVHIKSRRDTSMRRVKNIRTNIPLVGRFVIKIGKKSYVKSVRELIKKSKVAVRESMI